MSSRFNGFGSFEQAIVTDEPMLSLYVAEDERAAASL
jgi:hypothetical protein